MIACPQCNTPTLPGRCAHCHTDTAGVLWTGFRAASLLGLILVGTSCVEAMYGATVSEEDLDGDGSFQPYDCNDNHDTVFPGAQEVAGDGIDSDCDGEDDPAET